MNVISYHTRKELQTLYRKEMNARLARRIQGVYLAKMGRTCPEIMQIVGASRRTVQQWVAKYNQGRWEALFDKPRPGQPTKLPRHREKEFCQRIENGPTQDHGVSVLNGPAVQRILEREFGQIYSLWGVYGLLHRLGYSCLCPRPQHEQAGGQAQEAFKKGSTKCWTKSSHTIPANESKCGSKMKRGLASRVR